MTKEEIAILTLKELKSWKGLPYFIKNPMQTEGVAVITKEIIDMAIEAIEQTRWIPVSKPPKKNGEYLVTLIDKDSDGDDIFVVDKAYWTGMNWTYKFLIVENVIAYKTLSEHFREEGEE